MECLVLTGLSGAGKSTAIHVLEDLGYYCADNIPAQLVEVFFKLCETAGDKGGKFAAVVDIRGFSAFSCDAVQLSERLNRISPKPKILYLDASDEVILNRYKESRRRHPVIDDNITDLMDAVKYERSTLSGVRLLADYVIDTSNLSLSKLRERIGEFINVAHDSLAIHICSFGFKSGLPQDADMVFDVRCLSNPFYIDELKSLTGLDAPVYDYIFSFDTAKELYTRIKDFVLFSLPLYKKEGKSRLVIAFGCTGGHHRSVSFAQRLYNDLKHQNPNTTISHRDIERGDIK